MSDVTSLDTGTAADLGRGGPTGLLKAVTAWAVAAETTGLVLGSLGIRLPSVLVSRGSFRPGDQFELSLLVFVVGLAVAVVGFVPLSLLLLARGRLCRRRPFLERSWLHVAAACGALALLAAGGVSLIVTSVWLLSVGLVSLFDPGQSRDSVPLVAFFFAQLVFWPAVVGLLAGRWLHPDLGPGALVRHPIAVRLVPRARTAVVLSVVAVSLAAASVRVETEMYRTCSRGDSCSEAVSVRGLPVPYLVPEMDSPQLRIAPLALAYDLIVFGFLATVALRLVQTVRRTSVLVPGGRPRQKKISPAATEDFSNHVS